MMYEKFCFIRIRIEYYRYNKDKPLKETLNIKSLMFLQHKYDDRKYLKIL